MGIKTECTSCGSDYRYPHSIGCPETMPKGATQLAYGIELRDLFAAFGLVFVCQQPASQYLHGAEIARAAYFLADALLKEREVNRNGSNDKT